MNLSKRFVYGVLFALVALIAGAAFAVQHGASVVQLVAILATGGGLVGTISAAPVQDTNNWKTWNITALDADTATSFAHGFGAAPDGFWITPALSEGTTNTSTWGMTVDATNVNLTKQNATGSGGTTPGTSVVAKVFLWRPQSAGR
jgi:hypothetical protein